MKKTFASSLVAMFALCVMLGGPALAQSAPPPVPTTRILAIGTLNPGVDFAAIRPILVLANKKGPVASEGPSFSPRSAWIKTCDSPSSRASISASRK